MSPPPPIRMPWGKYKDELLEDVPSDYLLYTLEGKRTRDKIFVRRMAQELISRLTKEHMPGANPDGSYGDPSAFRDAGWGPRASYSEPRPTVASTSPRLLRAMAENIVNEGFRKLAREHHPDKTGGSHEIMATLTDAVTRLRKFAAML